MQALSALTHEQRDFLLALFKDCREFYLSRADFDHDFKIMATASLDELYVEWKRINVSLAAGESLIPMLLPRWNVAALSTPRGVRAYRQTIGVFSRLEKGVDPSSAIADFKKRVSSTRSRLPDPYVVTARNLISSWLGPVPCLLELPPRHGPGAVAEGYQPYEKVHNAVMFPQLEKYGGSDLLYLNQHHKDAEPRPIVVHKHGITRVIAVPKDFKKPRIISAEPTTLMFLQQGVARYMMAVLEARCPFLNFRDQSVNAQLAANYKDVATLDLSNASDTVSRRIVRQLFPKEWADLLFALRSHFSKTPDGDIIPVRAFAPMGSALCFPVESIIFAAVTVAVMNAIGGDYFAGKKRQLVRVYGDDIILPVECARAVISVLTACGFEPNLSKCCYNGPFRESCGAEWYMGEDVTVFRPRTLNPFDCAPPKGVRASINAVPMVQHASRLYQLGFANAAQYLASTCKFPVAIGHGDSYAHPMLTWPWPGEVRWNKGLQRCEQVSTVVVQTAAPSDVGDCYAALFLGLVSSWSSRQVLTPRPKPKRKWVLAAPLADR